MVATMKKEKAPASGAKKNTNPNLKHESRATQSAWLLERLVTRGGVSVLDARAFGIMNPSQRISELRKRGLPIDSVRVDQADESGTMHRTAFYVWRGDQAKQTDFWGYRNG